LDKFWTLGKFQTKKKKREQKISKLEIWADLKKSIFIIKFMSFQRLFSRFFQQNF